MPGPARPDPPSDHGPPAPDHRHQYPPGADHGCQSAGGIVAVRHRRRPGKGPTIRQKYVNRAHARLRRPVERSIARLKTWRILCKARCSPTG
ncbi:transposase family protein [Streptomyces cinereoruber]|uniref:transposase family protein n=1 Tax=Streptomyces cinereoruber TaxID=67260 RepID=UPI00363A484B